MIILLLLALMTEIFYLHYDEKHTGGTVFGQIFAPDLRYYVSLGNLIHSISNFTLEMIKLFFASSNGLESIVPCHAYCPYAIKI